MADAIEQVADMISAPVKEVIVALATGIAQAQRDLDRNSIEMQKEIDQDPVLSDLGLRATWYQMPRTELELTVAIALEEDKAATGKAATGSPVLEAPKLKRLYLQPVNAFYAGQFNYDVNASSKVKLTIVPVPPPAEGALPKMTREQVVSAAMPYLQLDAAGNLAAGTSLAVNFNTPTRMWFVLQYTSAAGKITSQAMAAVDDDSGGIIKHG